jgi:hypothetical protein
MKSIKKLLIILSLGVTISACVTGARAKNEDFTVNMNSPQITIGEAEFQLETLMGLGKLRKETASVIYFPREDVICVKYKFDFYTYNQFWNKKGRLNFINALQKYNEDYDARDLQMNVGKTQRKYGIIRGYLVWQQLSFTIQARANMNVELGYTFKDRSPYFSVYQRDAEYIDSITRDNNRTSPNVTLYFTRAQAAKLAEIFEQYIIPDIDDISDENKDRNELKDAVNDVLDLLKPTKPEEADKDVY